MATVESLRGHLVDELADMLGAEEQLIEALPTMAERAASRELRAAFKSHLKETRTHASRLKQALKLLGESADSKTCEAMQGLLEEGEELMSGADAGALRDAMMITAAQKVEHYEIASYGTVRTYAQLLGERGVSRVLAQTLKEEKAADKKLTRIAEGSINKRAAREWHEQQTTAGLIQKSAEWVGATVGGAIRGVIPGAGAARKGSRGRTRTARTTDRAADSRRASSRRKKA